MVSGLFGLSSVFQELVPPGQHLGNLNTFPRTGFSPLWSSEGGTLNVHPSALRGFLSNHRVLDGPCNWFSVTQGSRRVSRGSECQAERVCGPVGLENSGLSRTLQVSWLEGFRSFGCSDGLCELWGISMGTGCKIQNLPI